MVAELLMMPGELAFKAERRPEGSWRKVILQNDSTREASREVREAAREGVESPTKSRCALVRTRTFRS